MLIRAAIAFSLLSLLAADAKADSEARNGKDFVRITAQACTNEKVLANITGRGESPLDYRAAQAEFNGEAFAACWTPDYKTGMVQLRYDDGDRGELSVRAFVPVQGI